MIRGSTIGLVVCFAASVSGAATLYVSASGSNTPPFDTWPRAATNIQIAIDAASAGDVVLVTNGVYASGGTVVYGMTNRVTINKAIEVRSVGGWASTTICGQGPHGDAAVRCVYLGTNAVLSGFTLTGGFTRVTGPGWENDCDGGGALCESGALVSNCLITGNSAYHGGGIKGRSNTVVCECRLVGNSALPASYAASGGGASGGRLIHCEIRDNQTAWGGGASGATIEGGTLRSNTARYGGGATSCSLEDCDVAGNLSYGWAGGGLYECSARGCTLRGNVAYTNGGGAYWSYLTNCAVTGNSAMYGGGVCQGTIERCTIVGNSATHSGGGACNGALRECLVAGNTAGENGGGGYFSGGGSMESCTVCDNSADVGGGVAYGDFIRNCIVVSNTASAIQTEAGRQNYFTVYSDTMNFVCTVPLPETGVGNSTQAPCFVNAAGGDYRLATNSPCIDAGTNQSWMSSSPDLDGRPRVLHRVVDLGAYEAVRPEWDTDADHMNDWAELLAGTNPSDSNSVFQAFCRIESTAGHELVVSWSSETGRVYGLQRSTNLVSDAFGHLVAAHLAATPPLNTYTDRTAAGSGPWLYRIGLE